MKNTILLYLLFLGPVAFSQPTYTSWLNKNVHPIAADTATHHDDLSFLPEVLHHNLVIGLGEASHGTREFYLQKKRVIQFLVTRLQYKNLGFEMSNSLTDPINQYLANGEGNLKDLTNSMVLYGTEEIYELFQWIADYNKTQQQENKVVLFGFDREDSWHDVLARERLMAENIVNYQKSSPHKTMIWAHNIHIAKDTTMAQVKAVGSYLKQAFGQQYYALGLDTYKGSVNVLADGQFEAHAFETPKESFSAIFAGADEERFYVDFDKALNPFTSMQQPITHINSNWTEARTLPIRPGLDFNGILFIRETTPSRRLAK
ncbi:erythromycin esterase-like protein [Pedobacter sp. CAN_A7]|uniref:erythromycin esterase family protein n=1 Tax=Pedobacter sp. CAN_A7 TaxID=2787722 RepID=UPI0018C9EE8A